MELQKWLMAVTLAALLDGTLTIVSLTHDVGGGVMRRPILSRAETLRLDRVTRCYIW